MIPSESAGGERPVAGRLSHRTRHSLQPASGRRGARRAGLDEARNRAAAEHNRLSHPNSPFVQADWDAYCRAMGTHTGAATAALAPGLDFTSFHHLQPAQRCLHHDQSIAEFVASQSQGRGAEKGASCEAAALLATHTDGSGSSGADEPGACAGSSEVSAVPAILRALLVDTEQYEGAPLSRLSAAHGGEQLDGLSPADMQVASGYGSLNCDIAAREHIRVHCDTVVTAVEIGLDGVLVRATRTDPAAAAASPHGSSARPVERHEPPADPRTLPG